MKYLSIISIVAILFSSCGKQLNLDPQGSPTISQFWKTSTDVAQGANAMYDQFNQEEFYGRGFMWFINASDDMVTGRPNGQADNIKNFNKAYVGGGYTEQQWQYRYVTIKRANDVIKYAPTVNMDATLRNQYIGEAYFLSSIMYMDLAANYGNAQAGVPILDKAITENPAPIARAKNVDENYNYLIADLKIAAQLLPSLENMPTSMIGRPHKVAAWAYLAKAYLYQKNYAQSEVYSDSVINYGKRDLEPNFADVFKASHNYGPEYIWSVVCNPASSGWGSKLPGVMLENKAWGLYNGWGYYMPTKQLRDCYDASDKRLKVTLLTEGDSFMFNGTQMVYRSQNAIKTGYQFNKYMDPFTYALNSGHVNPDPNNMVTDLNIPLLRFAEVILFSAEAKLMQGKNADALINRIRNRAGLTSISGATMADLKMERRRELAGELSDRHRDLVRWGDAQATYAKPLHNWDGSVAWPARNFDPAKHDVWAVPQQEINNSGGVIKQNAGWL